MRVAMKLIFSKPGSVSLLDEINKAPKYLRPLIDHIMPLLPSLSSPFSKAGLLLAVLALPLSMLFRGLFSYLNIYLMNWAAARAVADIRTKLFEHLQNLSQQFFSRARTGDLISRINNDTWVLYNIFSSTFASIIKDPVTILILTAYLVSQQPRLTLLSMVVFPVCLVPIVIYGRKVRPVLAE